MWVESVTLNWGTGTKTIYSSSDVVIPFGSTVNWSVTVKNGWSMGRNTGTFEMPRNNTTLSFEKPTQISGLSYTKSSNTSAIAIENHSILNRVTPANLPLYNSVTNFINSYAVVNNANAAANGLIKSKQNFEIGNAFYSRTESAYLVYRDATRNTSWQVLDSGFTSYSNKVFRIKS